MPGAALRARGRPQPRPHPQPSFSGAQFADIMASIPDVKSETGVKVRSTRAQPDGRVFHRVTEAAHRGTTLSTLRVVPSPRVGQFSRMESIGWVLPMTGTDRAAFPTRRGT